MKKRIFLPFSRLLRLCVILLILPLLFGCESHSVGSRPATSEPATTDASIPVIVPPQKRVALTFDDGPQCRDAEYGPNTKMLVDELNKYGFHATFFVVGNRVYKKGSLIDNGTLAYIAQHGHEIGIHAYNHVNIRDQYYDRCSEDMYLSQLQDTHSAITTAVPGYQVRLMRPIGGHISNVRVSECPYAVINWNVDSKDWQNTYVGVTTDEEAQERVNTIVENVMSQVSDGSIILMHDIYESSYDAALIILQRLYEEGYEVVTVSELLGSDLQTGRLYTSANG